MKTFLILIFINITLLLLPLKLISSSGKTDVGIYSDYGTWSDGITALEHFFDWHGITHNRIYNTDINTTDISSLYSSICFPGGYSYYYEIGIDSTGYETIKQFVSNGGSYIGICAGAYFACSKVVWEDTLYYYPLGLFQGSATGSIHEISAWSNYKMTNVRIYDTTLIKKFNKDTYSILYYGGPYYTADSSFKSDTIALFQDYKSQPSIIKFNYGKGKVLFLSTHLEIEENSTRDGTDFGSELTDPETEWDLLGSLFDDILNKVTDIKEEPKLNENNNDNKLISINPNPVKNLLNLQLNKEINGNIIIEIYDLFGNKIISENFSNNVESTLTIDINYLIPSLYLINIYNNSIFVCQQIFLKIE